VRSVVFLSGCPLRCVYCHNPDTWERQESQLTDAEELAARLLRFYSFIKNGGVTFSGGEPLLQAEFVTEVAERLKQEGLHIAIDTCGAPVTTATERLLAVADLFLLDIKMTTEEDYKRHTGGSLAATMAFLDKLEQLQKDVWIRHVVVPNINDNEEDILRLANLIRGYDCIKKVELLPFKNLCLEKYRTLGIPFPLDETPPMRTDFLKVLEGVLEEAIKS
jgi:pyruvate formate lyase activating enzyme